MKTMNKSGLILAIAALVSLPLSMSAQSPKGETQKPKSVQTTDRSGHSTVKHITMHSPRGEANRSKIVASTANSETDTLAEIRNSTLSPRARAMMGERAKQFEIAPLKK